MKLKSYRYNSVDQGGPMKVTNTYICIINLTTVICIILILPLKVFKF